MATGSRMPSWKERENNKRRERRRRAIAGKIYTGLRMYGHYKLPKHCDNNEVLKALCREAGWVVEDDGTTYRKGCKPVERMDLMGVSASASACSSYQPSPCISYNPSPPSSSIPTSPRYNKIPNPNTDPNSLIPWLQNLSSNSSSSSKFPHHLYIHGGSISAPVTPPLSSPGTPRFNESAFRAAWAGENQAFFPNSMPPSPGLSGAQTPLNESPTFSLVSSNPFGFRDVLSGAGSRMWTPGQSGACSPVVGADIPMADVIGSEFAFGSHTNGLVNAWEGERIHEECVADDLELKL